LNVREVAFALSCITRIEWAVRKRLKNRQNPW